MGQTRAGNRLVIVAGWALSFVAPFLAWALRHFWGRQAMLCSVALLPLSAWVLYWGRGKRSAASTDVLAESVMPAIAALILVGTAGLFVKPTGFGFAFVGGNLAVFLLMVYGQRNHRRRLARSKEWEADMDAKLAALQPEEAMRLIQEETERILVGSKMAPRRGLWLIAVVAILGAFLAFLALRSR